jgi:transcriptional regulator with XRE-family HTH domain
VADPRRLVGSRLQRLRREKGWSSAQELADESQAAGARSLNRSTLAKVEAGLRRLRGDEALTLARVLGVTPDDLLEPGEVRVFLSFAQGDDEIAREIGGNLAERGVDVVADIEAADAFVVLLSPGYLESQQTRRDRQLAERRDRLRAADSGTSFIHVLRVRDQPLPDTGTLTENDWMDVTDPELMRAALGRLVALVEQGKRAGTPTSGPSSAAILPAGPSLGQDGRQDELNRVLRGLTSAGGPHFWLVIAPPGLGKTTLLGQVSDAMAQLRPPWLTGRVDLHDQPADVRGDAGALLTQFFGIDSAVLGERGQLRNIAQEISRSGRPYLCVLDGAELLTGRTPGELRSSLREVYRLVQLTGNADVRLGFIAASRRDDQWRGVTPVPRLSLLPLAPLDMEAVERALRDLAGPARRGTYSGEEFRQIASQVHRLTEGLPALLDPVLEWIRAEEWLDRERLEDPEAFAELVHPYVETGLLAPGSLFPRGNAVTAEQVRVVKTAVRVLVRYRVFTQSHLRRHVEQDVSFKQELDDSRWPLESLWVALSGSALLRQPLNEPWQEFYAPIRRLLYRYFYRSPSARAEAHREARRLVEKWSARQSGKEQVVGLVECLWHEAAALRTEHFPITNELSKSSRAYLKELRQSDAYTVSELRSYAVKRIADDEELQAAIGDADVTDQLIDVVAAQLWELRAWLRRTCSLRTSDGRKRSTSLTRSRVCGKAVRVERCSCTVRAGLGRQCSCVLSPEYTRRMKMSLGWSLLTSMIPSSGCYRTWR